MPQNNTSEAEEQRLDELLRRSDALNTAVAAVEDWTCTPEAREETLEVLQQMADEASREFEGYRRALGLSESGAR